jgi:hypothetical protein
MRIVLFEAYSAFTRVTACTLALSPIRETLIERLSYFVTSMTAPIASGWSVCRVGLAPAGKGRLLTRTPNSDVQAKITRLASRVGPPGSCAGKTMVGSFDANSLMARSVAIER